MPTKEKKNIYCKFAIKETEKNQWGNTDTKHKPIANLFLTVIFLKIEFGSDSLFLHIYLLIFINVPPVTSRENDFEKARKMALYYMICKQKNLYLLLWLRHSCIFCCQACIGLICAI